MDFCAFRLSPRQPGGRLPWLPAALLLALLLTGCARHDRDPKDRREPATLLHADYRVHFTATRLKDKSLILSTSVPVTLGKRNTVQTSSKVATENEPALPRFAAELSPTQTAGTFQLVTKVAIREAARNKKGKLKVSKRNQGSLLPIRLGEEQVASTDSDPIQIAVRVDRR